MRYSYSRVDLFNNCPYHFKLRYLDKLTELPNYEASNPLLIGNALHEAIEHDLDTAINNYFNSFPVLTDDIILEAMKLEVVVPKVQEFLEQFIGFEMIHEYKIDKPDYVGYVDLILVAPTKECVVIDFKYSNNIKNYLDSGQLHIYKYYLEQDGFNVKKLGYLFVPKLNLKREESEDLFNYRKRVLDELEERDVQFVPIEYDEMEIIYFLNAKKRIEKAIKNNDFPKNVTGNCFACNPRFAPNYLEAIQNDKGEILMVLPKNERREKKIDTRPDFWIYGDSYVGKSTFVDNVENVLFLNTDGNTDNTTAPVVMIKDEVTKEGRRIKRKLAWEKFLEVIDALETEENDYEAVAIDLVEDLREYCRYYVFEQNGWEHESDGGYGKGWSKVQTEWQRAIKRLKALGYQLIYVSKELRKEITLKGGAVRTTFMPNIDEKTANFLTGTVDLTMRAFADSDDNRLLQLGKKHNVFGGGRFQFEVETCALDYNEFLEELKAAQEGKVTKRKTKKVVEDVEDEIEEIEDVETDDVEEEEEQQEEQQVEKPKRRTRKKREMIEDDEVPPGEELTENDQDDNEEEEEKPKRRRRKRV